MTVTGDKSWRTCSMIEAALMLLMALAIVTVVGERALDLVARLIK
jgi:hypothetical protein